MSAKLMEYFNKQPRLSVLSTSSKNGIVDVAVMGSPQMVDEKTIIAAFARRSHLCQPSRESKCCVHYNGAGIRGS